MAPPRAKVAPRSAAKTPPKGAAEPANTPVKKAEAAPAAEAVATLRLKDLVDTVATATGAKKPEAKKAVEATLAALAAALNAGSVLALPPLGKVRVVKTTATALTLKLRPVAGGQAGLALADQGEDS
ncbi:MAG: hypothetical protein B7Z10_01830 [Rhodobacterales bacterium 32-66-7]|nr:MAG: hypothetical protein B7Z10_01830 [Rhodobacterales bacterium 32-66-7]